jgi:hypothetical protein
MPGAAASTRSPVCSEESTLVVTAGQPRHRHSLRDGVNAYSRALPGVRDLIVTVACASRRVGPEGPTSPICRLSTSPGVPGPHAFAVRASAARHTARSRPSPPAPNTRDDREAPLSRARDARRGSYLYEKRKHNLSAGRSENQNRLKRLSNFDFSRRRFGGSLAIARGNTVKKFTCRANQLAAFFTSPRKRGEVRIGAWVEARNPSRLLHAKVMGFAAFIYPTHPWYPTEKYEVVR